MIIYILGLIFFSIIWFYQFKLPKQSSDKPLQKEEIPYQVVPHDIPIEDAEEFSNLLKENSTLQYLHLMKLTNEFTDKDLQELASLLNSTISETKQLIWDLLSKHIGEISLHADDNQIERDLKILFMNNSQVSNFLIAHLAERHKVTSEALENILFKLLIQTLN